MKKEHTEEALARLMEGRPGIRQVEEAVAMVSGSEERLEWLWRLARSAESRTAGYALWAMTHLPPCDAPWLAARQDALADMLLHETDASKKRLLLQLLKVQEFAPEGLRTDLLDFCLSKINAESEPYAVRCFGMYVAFRMCRHYPELLYELESRLDLLELQPLSPGLRSALRQTRARIARLCR